MKLSEKPHYKTKIRKR